jgi:hypothetical protein
MVAWQPTEVVAVTVKSESAVGFAKKLVTVSPVFQR